MLPTRSRATIISRTFAVHCVSRAYFTAAPGRESKSSAGEQSISRDRLAELLNEDLSREYQAIISYVVYSQVLKGAEFMSIAEQLELHAQQELKHALIISRQIDYLGKMPTVAPKAVRTSENAKEILRFDFAVSSPKCNSAA
jgi:bacterioferritin (cytochrome b1)